MDQVLDAKRRLLNAGVGITRQRLALAELLFGGPDRHVTAEQLYAESRGSACEVSFATIYNTLETFSKAGLLREVVADATRTYFDTNATPHHHFLVEETQALIDIPDHQVVVSKLPDMPSGMMMTDCEVIIRVRRQDRP